MNKKRTVVESFIKNMLQRITNDDSNVKIYESFFKSMSDEEFEVWINKLEKEETYVVLYAPHFSKINITVPNNLEIGKELGYEFFQKLWMSGANGNPSYLTPIPYLIVDLPVRRASQLLSKKISVPPHNRTVDRFTNQPVGESKGARISYEELQMLSSMGLENSLLELLKYRGGDKKGFNAMNAMINRYGVVNMNTLKNYAGGVESTRTFKTFLTCMHLSASL